MAKCSCSLHILSGEYGRRFEDEDEISEYPDYAIAAPYDTEVMIYLSRMPTKSVNYEDFGSSFEGHGTCAMIENCPKRILILGGND